MSGTSNNSANNLSKNNERSTTELTYEIEYTKTQLNEKIVENENYQQELYELRHKLKSCLATQKDLSEINEAQEEALVQQRTDSEKKNKLLFDQFVLEKKQYEERLSELQVSLSCKEKEYEELRDTLAAKEKLYAASRVTEPNLVEETSCLKAKIDSLINELERKQEFEEKLLSRQQQLEESVVSLQKSYDEVCDILQVKKNDLDSLNDILETTRDELVVCRSELESLKAVPASDSAKGNSLFAEIEDNRRELVQDMISLRKKYLYMKQTYEAKENEIRALKAERALLLRKWEDGSVENFDDSARLMETYKARIHELESKLKAEEKKSKLTCKSNEPADCNFSYLQSLLTAKKKEVAELLDKLEESATQKILQEEMKYEISKQLRQWRYKALSHQAQLLAVQNTIKCQDCLRITLKEAGDPMDAELSGDADQLNCQSTEPTTPSLPGMEHFETTLEKLLKVPRELREECKSLTAIDLEKSCEYDESIQLQSIIIVDESQIASPKAVSPYESKDSFSEMNKENRASSSNANVTILKSVLAKSEDKLLDAKDQEKTKKSLRFATDTVDPQKSKLTRKKAEKKTYPVVFISN